MSVTTLGPIPGGPPSFIGGMLGICVGVTGLLVIIFRVATVGRKAFDAKKLVFPILILIIFIIGGLFEISKFR
jgi:hypothetical protein